MRETIRYALIDALGTALYVMIVASFLFLGLDGAFEQGEPTVLIPIAMLMLLVFSAAFVGALVFGRPIMWYLDGRKSEALGLLFYTLGIFFILTVFVFLAFFIVLSL